MRRTSRPRLGPSFPRLSVKGLNIGDRVNVFALAELAASYERARRIRSFGFEIILETRHLRRNRNRLPARNAGYSTIALRQFCNHSILTEVICTGRLEYTTMLDAKLHREGIEPNREAQSGKRDDAAYMVYRPREDRRAGAESARQNTTGILRRR
jgi:hypothetical protein